MSHLLKRRLRATDTSFEETLHFIQIPAFCRLFLPSMPPHQNGGKLITFLLKLKKKCLLKQRVHKD